MHSQIARALRQARGGGSIGLCTWARLFGPRYLRFAHIAQRSDIGMLARKSRRTAFARATTEHAE
jgi:hypothetical protein